MRWLSSQSVAKKEGSSGGGERVLEQGSLWVKRGCSVFSLLAFLEMLQEQRVECAKREWPREGEVKKH